MLSIAKNQRLLEILAFVHRDLMISQHQNCRPVPSHLPGLKGLLMRRSFPIFCLPA
jgi:hypothetical protein